MATRPTTSGRGALIVLKSQDGINGGQRDALAAPRALHRACSLHSNLRDLYQRFINVLSGLIRSRFLLVA